jgi:predicted secreted protein
MSIQASEKATCQVADAALATPIYYPLASLSVLRFEVDQHFIRANDVQDLAFMQSLPAGDRWVKIMLDGFSDDSPAEKVLMAAVLTGKPCLLRLITAQNDTLNGVFYITRLSKDSSAGQLEHVRVELRSDGVVTVV